MILLILYEIITYICPPYLWIHQISCYNIIYDAVFGNSEINLTTDKNFDDLMVQNQLAKFDAITLKTYKRYYKRK